MNWFKCFYAGRTVELQAASLYAAKLAAIAHFKAPKSRQHMISVVLCEREDGSPVIHVPGNV